MNLADELASEHSRHQCERIVAWVGDRKDRFSELVGTVLGDDEFLARRAAWAMGHCVEETPELAAPHLEMLVERMRDQDRHPAIRRNIARILQVVSLPENLLAPLFDQCFELLTNPNEPPSVQAYSMTILSRICSVEPALAPEVILAIESGMSSGSGAYRSRGRRTLRELKALKS